MYLVDRVASPIENGLIGGSLNWKPGPDQNHMNLNEWTIVS